MRPEAGEIVRIGKAAFIITMVAEMGDDRWVVWLRLLGRGKRRYTTHAWRTASGEIAYGEPLLVVA